MPRPDLSRVATYFQRYINQVQEDELIPALRNQAGKFLSFLKSIPADKVNYRYAEDKWTVKEVVQHIIDTERVFAYRALCFSRKEQQPLPGFDENLYADNSEAGHRDWNDMIDEFRVVRESTNLLYSSFTEVQMDRGGIASGNQNYVLGIGFIIAGHVTHHESILKERYL